ncbi:MAG: S49 family peptidase [Bauldia sp.]|nr:S49 family peptidase [Bauldia sp.]
MRFNLFGKKGTVIPVVQVAGGIGMTMPLRSGVSSASLEPHLVRAFSIKAAPAVAIRINSPGGSAVQSHLIHKRIRQLAAEKKKAVIVAVEDVAASGGYMIALAGDEIVVDASSIVGSIGVVFAGFGFQRLIDKLGIERRVHTAGEAKVILDPFQPEKEEDVERLKALQREVHESFIGLVKACRPRLADNPDLFTGAFWSGERAVALGLADRVGDLHAVLKEKYGEDVELKAIGAERGFLRRRLGLGSRGGVEAQAMAEGAIAVIEERMLWNRYGL